MEATPPRNRPAQHGATLLELLMALAVALVLLGLALPSLGSLLRHQRIAAAQMELIASLQSARADAINRDGRVLACPSADASRCDDSLHWEHGWLIARDDDRDHQPDGVPLLTHARQSGKLSILGSPGRKHVLFLPDGSAAGSNITLLLCDPGASERVLGVVVANSGRVRGMQVTDPHQIARCLGETN